MTRLAGDASATQASPIVSVLVIGAGMAGIGTAIRLKQQGIDDYLVLEKSAGPGETWRENTYPGCACDVPSRLYSYSFEPNPDWTRTFAAQPEILAYLERMVRKHALAARIRHGVEMVAARWDEAAHHWAVETTAGLFLARVLVCATGPIHVPSLPAIPGLDAFAGEVFHSSRWRHDLPLAGKRVAVVGTGASAIQFVPKIQPEVAELHLFQRTPSWVLPKADRAIPEAARRRFARFPILQQAMRRIEFAWFEVLGIGFRHPALLKRLEKLGLRWLEGQVRDPVLRRKLTPGFSIGCKRLLLSNTYLRSLTRPNVTLHATALASVDGSRVTGKDGSAADVDAIILATGFHVADLPIARHLFDGQGNRLADQWAKTGAQAYLGTNIAGFPNLFLMLGPNLGTGHSSAFTIVEAQLGYLLKALAHMKRKGLQSIDVLPEVQARHNEHVQAALAGTIYNAGGCSSYYLDERGRNTFAWPWSMRRLRRSLRRFDATGYRSA